MNEREPDGYVYRLIAPDGKKQLWCGCDKDTYDYILETDAADIEVATVYITARKPQ